MTAVRLRISLGFFQGFFCVIIPFCQRWQNGSDATNIRTHNLYSKEYTVQTINTIPVITPVKLLK